MEKYYLTPESLPDWSDYFSQVVVVEKNGIKMVYIAGQVGVDNQKKIIDESNLQRQAVQAFTNLGIALSSVGGNITDIVKMNIYVVNYRSEYAGQLSEVIQKYFPPGKLPAMSLIGVQSLANKEFLIEVDAEAVIETIA